jgi:hypothetical protein
MLLKASNRLLTSKRATVLIAAAFSAEPDTDCWLDPAANLFAAASAVAPVVTALASSAAGSAVFQLVEAVAAQEAGQACPAARRHFAVLPEFLLPRPDSPGAAAVELALPQPRRADSSPSG